MGREGRAVLARGPTGARQVSVVAAARLVHQRRRSVRAFRPRLPRGNASVPYIRRRGHTPLHVERDRDGSGNWSASNAPLIRQVRTKNTVAKKAWKRQHLQVPASDYVTTPR